jgi:uncharacterized Zn-finger protein
VKDDEFPLQNICNECYTWLDVIYKFRLRCHMVNNTLRNHYTVNREDEITYESPMSFYVVKKGKKVESSKIVSVHRNGNRVGSNVNKAKQIKKLILKTEPTIEKKVKLEEIFVCNTCGKEFNTKNKLRRHMPVHIVIQCTECNKTFSTRTHLRFHIQTLHTKSVEASCEYCGKLFTNIFSCRKHITARHGINTIVECHICGTKLSNKRSLKVRPLSFQ